MEEENLCVSGEEGWHLPRASFDLSEFAGSALGLQVQKLQLLPNSLVKVLMKTVLCRLPFWGGYWQNVFAEESKFTGCDFNETVSKMRCFGGVCCNANLNGSVLRQVILDETRLTDSGLSECKVQGLQLQRGFNRDELL